VKKGESKICRPGAKGGGRQTKERVFGTPEFTEEKTEQPEDIRRSHLSNNDYYDKGEETSRRTGNLETFEELRKGWAGPSSSLNDRGEGPGNSQKRKKKQETEGTKTQGVKRAQRKLGETRR